MMNNSHSSPSAWLVRMLAELPGSPLSVTQHQDYLELSVLGGKPFRFEILARLGMTSNEAERTIQSLKDRRNGLVAPLIAVRRFNEITREHLAQERLSWVEASTGVIHLVGDGLYVNARVRPQMEQGSQARPTQLRGQSGVCAETILLAAKRGPEIRTGELALEARVSPALASGVLQRLERENAVKVHGRGRRDRVWTIIDPGIVLDLWAKEETTGRNEATIRTPIHVWARSTQDLLRRVPQIRTAVDRWAVGGLAAANLYVPTLTVDPELTLWIPEAASPARVAAALGAEAVGTGHNVMLQQSRGDTWARHRLPRDPSQREFVETGPVEEDGGPQWLIDHTDLPLAIREISGLRIVSPERAYVESRLHDRERSSEVADALRRRVLRFLPQAHSH